MRTLFCWFIIHVITHQVLGFLPREEKILAISCGDNKFYKDTSSKILYKSDVYRIGGQIAKRDDIQFTEKQTIFDENYDWNIHRTYVHDKKSFSYLLPFKRQGDYSLIMAFSEISDKEEKQRLFNIIVEDQIIIHSFDIYALSGGKMIPYYELIELSFQNKVLKNKQNDTIIKKYNETYQYLNVTFQSVVGIIKVDAIILYEGGFKEIKKHMTELFIKKSNIDEGLKINELKLFLQDNQQTCESENDFVFPLKQRFIKAIKEQKLQIHYKNSKTEQKQIPFIPKKSEKEVEQQDLKEKRKQNSQQMHINRKQPARKHQEILDYLKEQTYQMMIFIKDNILFFSCLFLHYIAISFLFRDRIKDKGGKNIPHSKHSYQYMQNKQNIYQTSNNIQQSMAQVQMKQNQVQYEDEN